VCRCGSLLVGKGKNDYFAAHLKMNASTLGPKAIANYNKNYRFPIILPLSPKEPAMAWAIILLCFILGSMIALRPSGRKKDFARSKNVDD
jgi:hypothetical protein